MELRGQTGTNGDTFPSSLMDTDDLQETLVPFTMELVPGWALQKQMLRQFGMKDDMFYWESTHFKGRKEILQKERPNKPSAIPGSRGWKGGLPISVPLCLDSYSSVTR